METSGRWKQMRLEASYWPVVHFTWILLTTVRTAAASTSSSVFSTWEKQVWQLWLLADSILMCGFGSVGGPYTWKTHSCCLSDILKISIFFLILNSSTVFKIQTQYEHSKSGNQMFHYLLNYLARLHDFFTTEGGNWRVSKTKASMAVLSEARCC